MSKALTIICLPFAGGSKYSYRPYMEKAPEFLNFITLEYPGRGSRMREPLITDIEDLLNDLYAQCSSIVERGDYAFYGHSMGGLLAYVLTKKIVQNSGKVPIYLFITGTTGPSAASRLEKKRSLLEKNEFIQEIKDFGGMPDEILQDDGFLFFYEPILRADFKASESYKHKPSSLLNIPITVITGSEEQMEKEDILTWQQETTLPIDFKVFPGGHFFIFKHVDAIMKIIAIKLSGIKRQ